MKDSAVFMSPTDVQSSKAASPNAANRKDSFEAAAAIGVLQKGQRIRSAFQSELQMDILMLHQISISEYHESNLKE